MRHVQLPAQHHAITIRDRILDRYSQIRKCTLQMSGEGAELFQVDEPIVKLLPVTNCFRIGHLVDGIEAFLVPDFFEPAMCQLYVFFRHGMPPGKCNEPEAETLHKVSELTEAVAKCTASSRKD